MENKNLNEINTNEITKEAWDAYQEDYRKLHLPDSSTYEMYVNGYVALDCYEPMISLIGDSRGIIINPGQYFMKGGTAHLKKTITDCHTLKIFGEYLIS